MVGGSKVETWAFQENPPEILPSNNGNIVAPKFCCPIVISSFTGSWRFFRGRINPGGVIFQAFS